MLIVQESLGVEDNEVEAELRVRRLMPTLPYLASDTHLVRLRAGPRDVSMNKATE